MFDLWISKCQFAFWFLPSLGTLLGGLLSGVTVYAAYLLGKYLRKKTQIKFPWTALTTCSAVFFWLFGQDINLLVHAAKLGATEHIALSLSLYALFVIGIWDAFFDKGIVRKLVRRFQKRSTFVDTIPPEKASVPALMAMTALMFILVSYTRNAEYFGTYWLAHQAEQYAHYLIRMPLFVAEATLGYVISHMLMLWAEKAHQAEEIMRDKERQAQNQLTYNPTDNQRLVTQAEIVVEEISKLVQARIEMNETGTHQPLLALQAQLRQLLESARIIAERNDQLDCDLTWIEKVCGLSNNDSPTTLGLDAQRAMQILRETKNKGELLLKEMTGSVREFPPIVVSYLTVGSQETSTEVLGSLDLRTLVKRSSELQAAMDRHLKIKQRVEAELLEEGAAATSQRVTVAVVNEMPPATLPQKVLA